MMEFWIENPLIEMIFVIASLLGVMVLGWSNLKIEPPHAAGIIKAELSVGERHQLRQSQIVKKVE